MRKALCAASLALLTGVGSVNILRACGDKFLVTSRGTRYQLAPAARKPAAILIYTNPASEVPKALAGVLVDTTLRRVGYRPTMVGTSAEFEKALSQGGWDLILVGLADAEVVSKRVQGHAGVLPLVVNATPEEMKQARRQYPVVLKAPAKSQAFLAAIDEALAKRPKEQAKVGKS